MTEPVVIGVKFIGFPREVTVYAIMSGDTTVYVGSTTQLIRDRIRCHILDAKNGSELPIHVWMRSNNYCFDATFLERVPENCRVEAERRWMHTLNGSLLNLTDGGPGMSGHKYAGTLHALRISDAIRTGQTCDCIYCGAKFWRKRKEILLGHNKFCSRSCYQSWQRGKTKTRCSA